MAPDDRDPKAAGDDEEIDWVEEASLESFPASDAPARPEPEAAGQEPRPRSRPEPAKGADAPPKAG